MPATNKQTTTFVIIKTIYQSLVILLLVLLYPPDTNFISTTHVLTHRDIQTVSRQRDNISNGSNISVNQQQYSSSGNSKLLAGPKIVPQSRDTIKHFEGSTLVLTCTLESIGDSKPSFEWFKDNQPLDSANHWLQTSSTSAEALKLSFDSLSFEQTTTTTHDDKQQRHVLHLNRRDFLTSPSFKQDLTNTRDNNSTTIAKRQTDDDCTRIKQNKLKATIEGDFNSVDNVNDARQFERIRPSKWSDKEQDGEEIKAESLPIELDSESNTSQEMASQATEKLKQIVHTIVPRSSYSKDANTLRNINDHRTNKDLIDHKKALAELSIYSSGKGQIGSGSLIGMPQQTAINNNNNNNRIVVDSHVDHSLLKIRDLVGTDSGDYKCLAKNQYGDDSSTAHVIVNVQLRWINAPTDLEVPLNRAIRIECSASGQPKPSIRWHRLPWNFGDSPLPTGSNFEVSEFNQGDRLTSYLTSKSIQLNDSGIYECLVGNTNNQLMMQSGDSIARMEQQTTAELRRPFKIKVNGKSCVVL